MSEGKPKMIRLNVAVDKDLHRLLRVRAAEEGTQLTRLVPRLLREALKKASQPPDAGTRDGAAGTFQYMADRRARQASVCVDGTE